MEASDVLDTPEAGRRVVRGGALRVAGFIVGTGLSVVGAALVARHLGPADYGQFQTVLALVMIVQAVSDLGMSALGLREYAQRRGADRERFMAVLLGLRLASTVIGLAAAVALALLLGYDETMLLGTVLMGISLVLALFQATLGIPIAAELRLGTVTALDVLRQVTLTATYAGLVVLGAGVLPFYAGAIPSAAVILVITAILVRGVVSLRPSFDLRGWLALLRPTIVFALAVAVGQLYIYTALVLTELVASELQTGLFAASFRVYVIVAAIPGVLVTSAFPLMSRAARDDRTRLSYATQRLFEGTAILGGAALLACVLGAEPIIAVVAGPQYEGAVEVLQIQGVALALTFVIVTWGFTLLAVHHHRAMIFANLVAMTVSAAAVLTLAASDGAKGAAVATVLGEITLAAGYIVAISRVDASMRPRFGRAARALPGLAAGLAAGLLVPLPAVFATLLGLAVYGAGLIVLRALPDEVAEHLPGLIPGRARR